MTDKMKSFVKGILLGMVGKPLPISQGKEPIGYLYGHIAKEGETPTHTIGGVGYVGAVLPKLLDSNSALPYKYILEMTDGSYTLTECTSKKTVSVKDGRGGFAYASLSADDVYHRVTDGEWDRGFSGEGYIVWANTDVYYKTSEALGELSGTLFMSASESVATANGASYNGIELPKLPTYPYAIIVDDHYGTDVIKVGYDSCLTNTPLIFTVGDDEYPDIHHQVPVNHYMGIELFYYPEEGDTEWESYGRMLSIALWDDDKIVWSNHNIYLDNGTIFFSKCDDPIPVYE